MRRIGKKTCHHTRNSSPSWRHSVLERGHVHLLCHLQLQQVWCCWGPPECWWPRYLPVWNITAMSPVLHTKTDLQVLFVHANIFYNYLRFKSSHSGTTTFFCMICSSTGVKSTLWCLLSSTGCTSIFYVRYKGVYISCATYCNVDIVNVNASGHFMPFCTDIRKGETGNGGSGPNVLKYRDKVFYCKVWIKNIILYNYTDKSVTSIKINICLKTPHQAMSL